jgi:hypothetical protein
MSTHTIQTMPTGDLREWRAELRRHVIAQAAERTATFWAHYEAMHAIEAELEKRARR